MFEFALTSTSFASERPSYVSRTNLCTVILESMRPFHTDPSLSEINTDSALNDLRVFRTNTLHQPRAEGSSKEIGTHVGEGDQNDAQLIAQRVRGIEDFFAEHAEETLTAGKTFVGGEVQEILDMQTEMTERLERDYFRRDLVNTLGAQLSALSWGILSIGIWNVLNMASSGHELAAGMIALLTAPIVAKLKPDRVYFYLRNQDFHYSKRVHRLEEVLNQPRQSQWYFDSVDFEISPEVLRTTWKVGLTPLADALEKEGVNPWLLPLKESQLQTRSRLFSHPKKNAKVQVDRLITFDSENRPRLTVFVRSALNKTETTPSGLSFTANDAGLALVPVAP